MKKKTIYILLTALTLTFVSCRDQFASINTDAAKTPPKVEFLYTEALKSMNVQNYFSWFWNYSRVMPWTQFLASSSGNNSQLAMMNDLFEDSEHMINVKRQMEAIRNTKDKMPKNIGDQYTYALAMCYPMTIHMGLIATDGSGSIPYSEAALAYFGEGNEALFTPKFDSQKELYTTWLQELKEVVETLNNEVKDADGNAIRQTSMGKNDFVYDGNVEKWAKYANSLRLKLAVRLLHQDRQLVEEVVADILKYPLLENPDDDFIWSPGSQWPNSSEDFNTATGSKHLLDFLRDNRDPRVRALFLKNDYNEDIINGFLEKGMKLPSFIESNIEKSADGKKFVAWKEVGEPWSRYYGVPVDLKSKEYVQNMEDYYTTQNRQLGAEPQLKTYVPWSGFNQTLLKGDYTYTYPTRPDASAIQLKRNSNITFNLLSAAEVNLYLAEFKVLGFSGLPKQASEYYQNGIKYSVMMYDKLAKLNNIPYYSRVEGMPASDLPIALKDGEIEDLLQNPNYQLTGAREEQLERIYVQMYIHFGLSPIDLFTTMRRTGVPMKNSSYFPQAVWDSKTGDELIIPRRFQIRALTKTDDLYEQRKIAYEEQNFTPGANDPVTLNKERIWFDISAPDYGEGPNY